MSIYSKYPYLLDQEFLIEVDRERVKTTKIQVTLLTWQEREIEDIEGTVTGGNLNIDGSTSMRRTGSISFVTDGSEFNYQELQSKFSPDKKIKVAFGFKNTFQNTKYPASVYPYIWFPQGLFFIQSCSVSHNLASCTVNMNIIDKMAMLNGQISGILPATVDFGTKDDYIEDVTGEGRIVTSQATMYQIIMEAVNHWGEEQIGKILIGDLDKTAKSVILWDNTYSPSGQSYGERIKYAESTFWINQTQLDSRPTNPETIREDLCVHVTTSKEDPQGGGSEPDPYGRDTSQDVYTDITNQEAIGYELTPFTYPGELVAAQGETITSVLDKIKNALGNYEYFYDVDGNFRFQEIKNYLNTSQSSNILAQLKRNNNSYGRTEDTVYYYDHIFEDSQGYIVDRTKGEAAYDFSDGVLVNAYSNVPDYSNIKNDFIVWGMRKSVDGTQYPIRYHLAIDKKPTEGGTYRGTMQEDKYGRKYFVNLEQIKDGEEVLPTDYVAKDWRSELYFQGVTAEGLATDPGYYYAELANEWPKLYDLENNHFLSDVVEHPEGIDYFLDFIDTSSGIGKYSISNIGRRTKVLKDDTINCIFEPPIEDLVYIKPLPRLIWTARDYCITLGLTEAVCLDDYKRRYPSYELNYITYNTYCEELLQDYYNTGFVALEQMSSSELEEFLAEVKDALENNRLIYSEEARKLGSIAIAYAVQDKINDQARYEADIDYCVEREQHYALPSEGLYNQISMRAVLNGADTAIKDLLYQYTAFNEQIALTTVPIYHLEPNTLIRAKDPETGINDLYLIKSIGINFANGSTMTINATRAKTKI